MGNRGPSSRYDLKEIKRMKKDGLSNAAIGRVLTPPTSGQNVGKLLRVETVSVETVSASHSKARPHHASPRAYKPKKPKKPSSGSTRSRARGRSTKELERKVEAQTEELKEIKGLLKRYLEADRTDNRIVCECGAKFTKKHRWWHNKFSEQHKQYENPGDEPAE